MAWSGPQEQWRLADELLAVSRADTAFADLYLQRARELLSAELSAEQYARLEDVDAEVATLTNGAASAMDAGDWGLVRELTARAAQNQRTASERAPIRQLAARVYGFDEALVDPLSPGLSGLAGVLSRELPAMRDSAVRRLERLAAEDAAWADLYVARRTALAGLSLGALEPHSDDGSATTTNLQARARQALENGDLSQLEQLSARILEAEQSAGNHQDRPDAAQPGAPAADDLTQPFPADVSARAAKLGLAPHRIESTFEQVRARFRPAWRPVVGSSGATNVHLSVSIPGDAPEALRDTLELLVNRAFVTSAGTRYMPWLHAEDVLVEDFDDPSPDENPGSPLLEALGFPGRRGLARRSIEKALRERGGAVVTGLGLDPHAYRLVCLPVDVFTRLGAKRGWGKQPIWTHFDGYMVSKERKLLALAGGDVRFGGLHDLIAVGTDYDSDRIFVRLAVVHRRRFSTW